MPAAHRQPVDDGLHPLHSSLIDVDLAGEVHALAVDDEPAAALLAHFGENEIQLLSVLFEYGSPQFNLRPFRERQNRLEDLARRSAGRQLPGIWAVRFANRREKQ